MESEGWVVSTAVAQAGRPDKRVYEVTDAGRAELRRWLGEPLLRESHRSDLAVKLRAASYGDRAALLREVAALRAEHATRLAAYEQMVAAQYPQPETLDGADLDQYLVLRGGVRMEEFWVEWLGEYLPHALHADHEDHAMTNPYPHLLSPLEVRGGTLRNRTVMGSMHTGLEDRPWHVDAAGGVLRRAGPRRRGADRDRRLRPQRARLAAAVRLADDHAAQRRPPPARHRGRARRGRQDRAADPARGSLRIHPVLRQRQRQQVPHHALQGVRDEQQYGRADNFDFVRSAELARKAGYDAVEVMGSEGYLINQFLAARVNKREDEWGGTAERRMRFPVEIVRRIREAVGDDFIVMYRMSLLDLVEGGQTWDETVELAHRVEDAGASIINTGIGWHEARVPTIVTQVPRAAFCWTTRRLREEVGIPVCASNRINTPEVAEAAARRRQRRPGLDGAPVPRRPGVRQQGRRGSRRRDQHLHRLQPGLPGPHLRRQARLLPGQPARLPRDRAGRCCPSRARAKQVAVVGAGPAGLAAALNAAERGHTRRRSSRPTDEIGGQFRSRCAIPGKEEFAETLRYYARRFEVLGVDVRLGTRVGAGELAAYDEVVVATGVVPRRLDLPGSDHPKVVATTTCWAGASRSAAAWPSSGPAASAST